MSALVFVHDFPLCGKLFVYTLTEVYFLFGNLDCGILVGASNAFIFLKF